jgi:arylsulfatase A
MTDAGTHVPLIVNCPGAVAAGKVSQDLVDFSDFLPTMCEVAGIALPTDRKLDGHSFAPQLRGQPGNPRSWIYCWYEREGRSKLARQFARTARYKLYDDGKVFDLSADPLEKHPLQTPQLNKDAAEVRSQLDKVLKEITRSPT